MRPKMNTQSEFDLQPSNLQITNDYFAKYQAISDILDDKEASWTRCTTISSRL